MATSPSPGFQPGVGYSGWARTFNVGLKRARRNT